MGSIFRIVPYTLAPSCALTVRTVPGPAAVPFHFQSIGGCGPVRKGEVGPLFRPNGGVNARATLRFTGACADC